MGWPVHQAQALVVGEADSFTEPWLELLLRQLVGVVALAQAVRIVPGLRLLRWDLRRCPD